MDGNNEKLVFTEEFVRNHAVSYIPLQEKEAFADFAAGRCFSRMELSTDSGDSVPPMWMENSGAKTRYMMAALARLYLRIPIDVEQEEDPWRMSEACYEALAEVRPISQLRRMSKSAGDQILRNKVYELLSDYRKLEKMLNEECAGRLTAMNDTVARLQSLISASATPENMKNISEAFSSTMREIDEYTKVRRKAE